MYTKQEIIIRSHREGKSHRQISQELQISRKTIKKYIEDFEKLQAGSTQPATALSTFLSSPPVYRIGLRGKVRLTQEVQPFINAQREGKTQQDYAYKSFITLKNKPAKELLTEKYSPQWSIEDFLILTAQWDLAGHRH